MVMIIMGLPETLCAVVTVGLQLAELSSIPRSVVEDAKIIAELVQRQIYVTYNVLNIKLIFVLEKSATMPGGITAQGNFPAGNAACAGSEELTIGHC